MKVNEEFVKCVEREYMSLIEEMNNTIEQLSTIHYVQSSLINLLLKNQSILFGKVEKEKYEDPVEDHDFVM